MLSRISLKPLIVVSVLAVLSACTTRPPEGVQQGEAFDPYESNNRGIHKFNLGVDRFLFRPASKGYVKIVPDPMVTSFNHFAENLTMPGQAVDYLLQGNLKQSGNALLQFVINTTVGGLGLSAPADELNLPPVDTDFGETLHVWGFGEGAYVELPLYGPSTQRDSIGVIVNLFSNPINFSPVRPVDNIGVYAEVVRRMGDRGRFSDTVDSILYESADSYAQARTIYLQNRRFELARDDEETYLGLYDDPYADNGTDPVRDPYLDPYEDPYEDPYAE
ncbi:VacJ family lipoprotein [Ruegeria sp. A3M17]|uniref:MlaA family lipoprotein n=1 Tax=Ruegeria sp. A3M17 TaxID=2267229 RepID=UPI000DEA0FF7|nr:VacJ family lipoprotein [Ruegeria sp. A3M17]RBW55147.1 VacJ family lipoprotein [Ruegeria sp. A3M17]